jgi:hypothetical protein
LYPLFPAFQIPPLGISRIAGWHGLRFLTGMFRRLLLPLLAAAAFMALPKSAFAQYYGSFGSGSLAYSPGEFTYTFTPKPPKATHNSRMDPHLIKAARIAEANAFPHSTMRCWRYVKQALLQAGAVAAYPVTNYACQAGAELTSRYGFVRLAIHDPYRAPVGSVLVYSDGGGAGHVELRTEHGFASDYRSAWACRYRLIGVYAKLSA